MILFPPALKLKHRTGRKDRKPEKIMEQEKGRWYESNFKARDWRFGGNHKTIVGAGGQVFLVKHLRLGWCW